MRGEFLSLSLLLLVSTVIPFISFCRFLSFQRNVSQALFVLSVSLSLFILQVDSVMLVQVKHRGRVLCKVFITKGGGGG